jgi:hypothetical protein
VQEYINTRIRNIELQTLLKQAKLNKKNVRDQSFNYKNIVFDSKRYSIYFEPSKKD